MNDLFSRHGWFLRPDHWPYLTSSPPLDVSLVPAQWPNDPSDPNQERPPSAPPPSGGILGNLGQETQGGADSVGYSTGILGFLPSTGPWAAPKDSTEWVPQTTASAWWQMRPPSENSDPARTSPSGLPIPPALPPVFPNAPQTTDANSFSSPIDHLVSGYACAESTPITRVDSDGQETGTITSRLRDFLLRRECRPSPTMFFPLGRCLDYCEMGNPGLMAAFCRQYTREGTPNRERCWRAVSDLEAGDVSSCKNDCHAIAKNWGR
jgi:hypothetical protein